jgi:hypothetical protein
MPIFEIPERVLAASRLVQLSLVQSFAFHDGDRLANSPPRSRYVTACLPRPISRRSH